MPSQLSQQNGMQPRVALDISDHWYIRGGIWRYSTSLARALVNLLPPGHVKILCFDRLYPERLQELRGTGADVGASGLPPYLSKLSTWHPKRTWLKPLHHWIRRWIKPVPPNSFETPLKQIAQAAIGRVDVCQFMSVARFPGDRWPCVGTVYDLTPIKFPHFHSESPENFERLIRNVARNCQRIIAISDCTRQDLVKQLEIDDTRVHVVYPGIDLEVFSRGSIPDWHTLAKFGLTERGFFLYVGTLEPRKNLDRLIDAYLQARQARKLTLPLVLVGVWGWKMDHLRKRLASAELAGKVRHLGHVSDEELIALYRAARACLYVSLYEGFGIPPLEAMACGTPVLVSNRSSLPEVVGNAGVLVDPDQTDEIAVNIQRLAESDSLTERLREAGWRRAQQFTWKASAQKAIEVYQETKHEALVARARLNETGAAPSP